jgi:hypothetical protein
LCCFTGKFFTFETQVNALLKSTITDFAEFVFSRGTTFIAIRTLLLNHAGTFLTGNTANANFHVSSSTISVKNKTPTMITSIEP